MGGWLNFVELGDCHVAGMQRTHACSSQRHCTGELWEGVVWLVPTDIHEVKAAEDNAVKAQSNLAACPCIIIYSNGWIDR
jgi:hypothetical protein